MFLERIRDKFTFLISSSFGLVAALAWNEAIREILDKFFPPDNLYIPMLVYAITVTGITILVISIIQKTGSKVKDP